MAKTKRKSTPTPVEVDYLANWYERGDPVATLARLEKQARSALADPNFHWVRSMTTMTPQGRVSWRTRNANTGTDSEGSQED